MKEIQEEMAKSVRSHADRVRRCVARPVTSLAVESLRGGTVLGHSRTAPGVRVAHAASVRVSQAG